MIKSTKSQVEEFMDSFIWKDMIDELDILEKRMIAEYPTVGMVERDKEGNEIKPTTADILMHLGEINGHLKALSYFRSLPEIFLQYFEEKENDSEHEPAK